MIRRVELTNYGPFASAKLEMGPLTVVVGPNASGKSKLLELLDRMAQRELSILQTFFERTARRGTDISAVALEMRDGKSTSLTLKRQTPVEGWEQGPGLLLDALFLKLNPDVLRSPSYIDSVEPLMREDGYGLATTLAYLKLNNSGTFDRLLEQTREIVPTFETLRFKRTRVKTSDDGEVFGDELIFDMKGAPDLPPDAVSDGTLLTVGLLTSTMVYSTRHADAGPLLFLIDDLERGLHPRAMGELVAQLRRLTETAGVQILATSHSPYLLDALKPEEVRLTGFLDDGSATIRALAEHPDFERWKDEMTPGEMWSLVGEDWIA